VSLCRGAKSVHSSRIVHISPLGAFNGVDPDQPGRMTTIDELLLEQNHVGHRDQLNALIGRIRTDAEIRGGNLVRLFPRVYARPWQADQPDVREHAALLSVGGDNALSHLTALSSWQLPVPPGASIHVTAYQPRHPRGVPDELVVHRTLLPLRHRWVDGRPVTEPELAIVTSWPLLTTEHRRPPIIEAGRRGLLRPDVLTTLIESMYWIAGRRDLREIAALVLGGCESELELWGCRHVFDVDGLRHGVRQRVVQIGWRQFRLDLSYDRERVAVELDGRAYHASSAQWERDIERDLLLATAGWLTIRLSYWRLHNDPDGCRRDVLRVLEARQHQQAS